MDHLRPRHLLRAVCHDRLVQISGKAPVLSLVPAAGEGHHLQGVAGELQAVRGMDVGPWVGDKAQPLVQQRLGQHAGVLCDILLIFFEFRLQRFAEAHGLGRDDMLQRAAPEKLALLWELCAFDPSGPAHHINSPTRVSP